MYSNVMLNIQYLIYPLFVATDLFSPSVDSGCEPIHPVLWRWEAKARAGAGVAALYSLWLRRRRDRVPSPAVGGLVH